MAETFFYLKTVNKFYPHRAYIMYVISTLPSKWLMHMWDDDSIKSAIKIHKTYCTLWNNYENIPFRVITSLSILMVVGEKRGRDPCLWEKGIGVPGIGVSIGTATGVSIHRCIVYCTRWPKVTLGHYRWISGLAHNTPSQPQKSLTWTENLVH
jgi:hypothetical protein